jgi:PAS domain S-box-containing protein
MEPEAKREGNKTDQATFETVTRLLDTLAGDVELNLLLPRVLDRTLELFGFPAGELRLYDAATDELRLAAGAGLSPELRKQLSQPFRGEDAPAALGLQRDGLAVVEDLASSPYAQSPWSRYGYRTFVSAPLRFRGRPLGRLNLFSEALRPLTGAERELLTAIANQVGRAIADAQRLALEEALREREARFRTLCTVAPIGIYQTDALGRTVYTNPRWQLLSGLTEEESLGDGWTQAIHPDDRERVKAEWYAAVREHSEYRVEYRLLSPGRTVRWMLSRAAAILSPDGQSTGYVGTVEDITDRVQAELEATEQARQAAFMTEVGAALTTSETLAAGLQQCARAMVASLDVAFAGIWTLEESEEMLQLQGSAGPYPAGEALPIRVPVGHTWIGRITQTCDADRDRALPDDPSAAAREWARPDGIAGAAGYPLILKDRLVGALALVSSRPIPPATSRALEAAADVIALAIDRKQTEARLWETTRRLTILSRRLLEAQEAERLQLARELHDEIGQLLTSVDLMLQAAMRSPVERVPERLDEVYALIHELADRARELSLDLRPAMLDDLGLVATLRWYLDRYMARTGVRVRFEPAGAEQRYPTAVETAAYRIAQEALTNVARHAGVHEATVRLQSGSDALRLQVEDRGAGFDPRSALALGSSSGLIGMRERATLAGGRLLIEAAPGHGARLLAEFPLGPPERENGDR